MIVNGKLFAPNIIQDVETSADVGVEVEWDQKIYEVTGVFSHFILTLP